MTHVPIDIDAISWDNYFSGGPQIGGGGGAGLNWFVGQRYMRGYGVLGSIGRFLLPIAKNIASSVGSEGVEAGTRVLKDVSEGRNLSEALKEHSMKGITNLGAKMKQCGKGKRKRKKQPALGVKKPMVSAYPERPASPTPTSTIKQKRELVVAGGRKQRKRKPDQLDIF